MANTSLITLPIELIHRILNNLDVYFINVSVRKVCKRLYLFVNFYNRYEFDLDLLSKSRLKIISRFIQPERITSLVLLNRSYALEKIKFFFSLFDINQLTQLRSITLGQFDQLKDAEFLQHLTISNLVSINIRSTSADNRNQLPFISKIMNQSSFLRMYLAESYYSISLIPWTNPCSIIYLTIKSCSLKEYDLLLQRLPYLRTFSTGEFIIDKLNQLNSSPSILKSYSQLMSLMIENGSLSMTDFELILSLTPSLTRLKLISYKSNLFSIANGSDWEYLIHNKLPNLKMFEFFFSYRLQKENEAEDLTLFLNQFRTLFWLKEKKWIVTCDYVLKQNVIYIYTTPVYTKDFEQQLQSIKKTSQPFPFILRFKFLSMNNEFHSTIHLIHGIDDVAEPRTIQHINLEKNGIGEDGTRYLAETITSIKVIVYLIFL
ncbi:unnamed protein product [Rotaria sp. Silwood2]|nr:unnamed protein product [Rotaria sp. Silwood2]